MATTNASVSTSIPTHFHTYACQHSACQISGATSLSESFRLMSENVRVDTVRCMLLCITCPPGATNQLMETSPANSDERKKRRRDSEGRENCTTKYVLRGQRVCLNMFSAITHITPRVIQLHASDVSTTCTFSRYTTEHSDSRKGKKGANRIAVTAFLKRYSYMNGLPCPTGRGSTENDHVVLLPSDIAKIDVYVEYKRQWSDLIHHAQEVATSGSSAPETPVRYPHFVSIWKDECPFIKISRPGSDFCDTCPTLKNAIASNSDDIAREDLRQTLEKHLKDARTETDFLKIHRSKSKMQSAEYVHVIVDFAEKVLLPSLLRQTGQLHFITGLKNDLFGVSCANINTNYIFSLAEGHWPGGKTANEVASMLLCTLIMIKEEMTSTMPKKLMVHCDNCAGQNKNRFMLWFCSWLVASNLFNEVQLNFLVAGHTKNECDGAFGCIKRKMKIRNILCPMDMRSVISESSQYSKAISASHVTWVDWKTYLSAMFKLPAKLKINSYHQFTFRKHKPCGTVCKSGLLFARSLSTSDLWEEFDLFRRGVTFENHTFSSIGGALATNLVPIVPLEEVSVGKQSRKDYLKREICLRYYAGAPDFSAKYFSE